MNVTVNAFSDGAVMCSAVGPTELDAMNLCLTTARAIFGRAAEGFTFGLAEPDAETKHFALAHPEDEDVTDMCRVCGVDIPAGDGECDKCANR